MKVIKVGTTAQSRIAQACDRCRSKKIRCDGVRPTCSQCANVGFECRTSDKLSRRAFPRGYTESLEERVRVLEAEVRELKDLLDEKDEKIDMLSQMHTNRRRRPSSDSPSAHGSPEFERSVSLAREDKFRIQASPPVSGVESSDSYLMGASSGRAFIGRPNYHPFLLTSLLTLTSTEAFKRKLKQSGKPCDDFKTEAFHPQNCQPLPLKFEEEVLRAPPRLLTDRCVNVYFQEWAPLFPVLHKPTFLRLYEDFVADSEQIRDPHKIAQLYLVFSIAGLLQVNPDMHQLAVCERQWTRAVDSILMENTMSTLQCLVMAILTCIMRADYKRMQHYKGIAVGLSHRLGLHQSQKQVTLGALAVETRKKVFWTLYTLDCFSASILGLPKFLNEDDIETEYPSDTDDEYVTEKGFQPTLPGESTRISSALGLFKAARILARVLEQVYPASEAHDLSLQQLSNLCGELDSWYENLPAHLRLNFAQDKPSTDVTGSRSPLLSVAYHFIRILIYRPAVGSGLGAKAAPALLAIGDSSKHLVQIIQLLEERRMAFAFCLNKMDLLTICGMTLLYRTVDLSKDSKLMRDDERLVNAVYGILKRMRSPTLGEFRRAADLLVSLEESQNMAPPVRTCSTRSAPAKRPSIAASASPSTSSPSRSPIQQRIKCNIGRQMDASASESDLIQQQEKLRRMTMSSVEGLKSRPRQAAPRQSFDGIRQAGPLAGLDTHFFMSNDAQDPTVPRSKPHVNYASQPNGRPLGQPSPSTHSFAQPSPIFYHQNRAMTDGPALAKPCALSGQDWEAMLGTLDNSFNNVYDAIYGGPGFKYESTMPAQAYSSSWSPDSVDMSAFAIGGLDDCTGPPRSVHSLSDESLSSGEEVGPTDLGLATSTVDYHNSTLAVACGGNEGFIFEGLEGFTL
jgi:hypothetical protein